MATDAETKRLRQRVADARLILVELRRFEDEAYLEHEDQRRLRALLTDLQAALVEE